MGLQSKTGTGIKTKVRQPYQREDRVALAEKGERIRQLWQGEERGSHGFGGERRNRGPRGFGGVVGENNAALAEWGPHGGDTADGAGSLNHGLLLLFLRYGTPDWAKGEGRTVCVCGYSKGL